MSENSSFNKINSSRLCHVHTAFSRYRKRQEQKAVDVLLAIEVLQHAYQGNMDVATIITSDLDFAPVFDALTQTKVSSELIYQKGSTSDDLIYCADTSTPILLKDVASWLNEPYNRQMRVWSSGSQLSSPFQEIERKKILDVQIVLGKLEQEDGFVALIDTDNPRYYIGGSLYALKDYINNSTDYNISLQWK